MGRLLQCVRHDERKGVNTLFGQRLHIFGSCRTANAAFGRLLIMHTSRLFHETLANILGLRWKIQGKARVDGDPIIDDYLTLYTSVRARTDSSDHAWGSVCQAMFTHPDFFMY